MHGAVSPAQLPSARLPASTGLTPAACTASRTCPGPGTGSATSARRSCSGPPNSSTTTAFNQASSRPLAAPRPDTGAILEVSEPEEAFGVAVRDLLLVGRAQRPVPEKRGGLEAVGEGIVDREQHAV